MKKIAIIGYGEVGASLGKVYEESDLKCSITPVDPEKGYAFRPYEISFDVMDICIPYFPTFIDVAAEYIMKYQPKLVIVHSSVPPGITRQLNDIVFPPVVHSPVTGVHPNLKEGIQTFTKMIGAVTKDAADKTAEHFKAIGIKPIIYNSPEETELAKMLSTSYYGWNIIYMKYVNDLCKKMDLDFDNVYESTNHLYNEGYDELGLRYVRRPILKPMPGIIGGHCIRQNMEHLKDIFPLAKLGLSLDDDVSIEPNPDNEYAIEYIIEGDDDSTEQMD